VPLRELLDRNFRSLSLGGFGVVFLLAIVAFVLLGRSVSARTARTILDIAKADLVELTLREARLRNDPFERVAALARVLQRDQEAVLASPELHPPPRGAITLQAAANGSAYKVEKNGGGSVFVPARTPLTPELVRFAQVTEAFDPLMESVLAAMPAMVLAAYFNSEESLNRYVPFIDAVAEQFAPDIDTRSFNFYYVADEQHDPEGAPRWTDAYLDPAGQGWMVTCAVPIRAGGRLRGVTGLDVTIGQLLRSVVETPLPSEGAAMLTTAQGQILALSPRLEAALGLKELVSHDYGGKAVQAETLKPEEFQVARSSSREAREYFARTLPLGAAGDAEELSLAGRAYLATHGVIPETGWRLFVFTPKDALLAPMADLRSEALAAFAVMLSLFVLVGALVALLVLRRSRKVARAIAEPLRRLSEETGMLGTRLSTGALAAVGIEEVDLLSRNFGTMTAELAQRQQAAMEAEVARSVQKRSEELLLKVLPEPIVARMMRGERVIADAHEAVTVVFADVVGFTPIAAALPPRELVDLLGRVFVAYDEIVRRHGIEKIKTIGDAYMAVAGAPMPCEDHALRAARAALEMRDVLTRLDVGHRLQMRIGLHSGPAVAGVIGHEKFLYDLWGDTVNVASRLESHGEPGRIQLSEETAALLGDRFRLEPRGIVELKGRGPTRTLWLVEERTGAQAA
jgi:class 3 adenylate cyclase